jgi:hypothetical protein
MKEVSFEYPNDNAEFPEDAILVEKNYASGETCYFVYEGRVLREVDRYPSTQNRTAHYDILNRLRDKYPGFEIKSQTWNPIRKRTEGNNLTFNPPVRLVVE